MAVLTSPNGTKLDVPASVVEDYLEQGYTDPNAVQPASSTPDGSWTVKQLEAYAAEHGIELQPGSLKADKLERITRHSDD